MQTFLISGGFLYNQKKDYLFNISKDNRITQILPNFEGFSSRSIYDYLLPVTSPKIPLEIFLKILHETFNQLCQEYRFDKALRIMTCSKIGFEYFYNHIFSIVDYSILSFESKISRIASMMKYAHLLLKSYLTVRRPGLGLIDEIVIELDIECTAESFSSTIEYIHWEDFNFNSINIRPDLVKLATKEPVAILRLSHLNGDTIFLRNATRINTFIKADSISGPIFFFQPTYLEGIVTLPLNSANCRFKEMFSKFIKLCFGKTSGVFFSNNQYSITEGIRIYFYEEF